MKATRPRATVAASSKPKPQAGRPKTVPSQKTLPRPTTKPTTTNRRRRAVPTAPTTVTLPPHVRRPRPEYGKGGLQPALDEYVDVIALNVARSASWHERRQHLMPLLDFSLTYQQLSSIVHRFPTFEERVRAMELLKDHILDSEHWFYLFVQGFALIDERRTISQIFQIAIDDPPHVRSPPKAPGEEPRPIGADP
jgi:hypothetical protein